VEDKSAVATASRSTARFPSLSLAKESQMSPLKDEKNAMNRIPSGSEFDSEHIPAVAAAAL
jgi:hypothetical protein